MGPGQGRCHISTNTSMTGGKSASMCAAIEVDLRRWRGSEAHLSLLQSNHKVEDTATHYKWTPALIAGWWRMFWDNLTGWTEFGQFHSNVCSNSGIVSYQRQVSPVQISLSNTKVEFHALPGAHLRLSPCVSSFSRERMKGVISRPVTPLKQIRFQDHLGHIWESIIY